MVKIFFMVLMIESLRSWQSMRDVPRFLSVRRRLNFMYGFALHSVRDNNQRFVLELVRIPSRLHYELYADRDCGFRFRWSYCLASAAKAQSGSLKLMSVST